MLVIFDCDGVLVDSEPLSNAALSEALHEIGLPLSVEQTVAEFKGRSWRSVQARVAELLGGPVPPSLHPDYVTRRDIAFQDALRPVPGVIDALDALDGRPACVASSGDHDKMRLTLGMTGLLERFEGRIFSATEVEHGKPAPDLFLHAASSMGFAPQDCVVVEDSAVGVEAALAAGMQVLGFDVDGGHARFDDMSELPELLRNLDAGKTGSVDDQRVEPAAKQAALALETLRALRPNVEGHSMAFSHQALERSIAHTESALLALDDGDLRSAIERADAALAGLRVLDGDADVEPAMAALEASISALEE